MLNISSILGNTIGAAETASASLASDFTTFLTLLTTQLQAQDPLDPMSSSEFTSQLVQFTAVEQAIRANQNLENLAALTAFNGITNSVAYIGKLITTEQAETSLENGSATWIYDLSSRSSKTDLTIRDSAGRTVRSLEGKNEQGAHQIIWDGRDNFGQTVADGVYTLVVSAKTVNGNNIPAQVFMQGLVQGVEISGGQGQLAVGGFLIPITSVSAVSLPRDPAPPGP